MQLLFVIVLVLDFKWSRLSIGKTPAFAEEGGSSEWHLCLLLTFCRDIHPCEVRRPASICVASALSGKTWEYLSLQFLFWSLSLPLQLAWWNTADDSVLCQSPKLHLSATFNVGRFWLLVVLETGRREKEKRKQQRQERRPGQIPVLTVTDWLSQ